MISKKDFAKALTIKQVGAKYRGTIKKKLLYELGNGLFTEKEILKSRQRIAKYKYNVKAPKKLFGL